MTKFWTNQTIKMQSAIGAAIAITSISKGANAKVATGGALPSNDAYVLLEVKGMRQVNNRIFKVSGSGSGEFDINVDSTDFTDFTTGTFRVVTMGLTFSGTRDVSSTGGDAVVEDTTTVQDFEDVEEIVSSSPQKMNWTQDWDPSDAVLKACNNAFVTRAARAFLFIDPDGDEYAFYGTVSAPLNPTVSGRKKVTPINISLKATGTAIEG